MLNDTIMNLSYNFSIIKHIYMHDINIHANTYMYIHVCHSIYVSIIIYIILCIGLYIGY